MSILSENTEIIGFFSYSREDDQDSTEGLSELRDRIQRELRGQLGLSAGSFRLWQDREAIAPGTLWESEINAAVGKSMFFIPIITPTAVRSPFCRFEFQAFLKREEELGRKDLVFPILYIRVASLEDRAIWEADDVLSVIGHRQYVDWRRFRHRSVATPEFREEIEALCSKIADALSRNVASKNARDIPVRSTEDPSSRGEATGPSTPAVAEVKIAPQPVELDPKTLALQAPASSSSFGKFLFGILGVGIVALVAFLVTQFTFHGSKNDGKPPPSERVSRSGDTPAVPEHTAVSPAAPAKIEHVTGLQAPISLKPRKLIWPGQSLLAGPAQRILALAISPNNRYLITSDDLIKLTLWDANTGSVINEFAVPPKANVYSVVFSPDGQYVATGSMDKTAVIWSTWNGYPERTLRDHHGPVTSVAFSPDGRLLATGSTDTTVKVWDVESGRLNVTMRGNTSAINSVAVSPTDRIVASGGDDDTVRLWNLDTGSAIRTFAHPNGVFSVAFSPDGTLLASGGRDHTVMLWDVKSGTLLRMFTGHTDMVRSVAFFPDGHTIASAASDNTIKLWNTDTGELRTTLPDIKGPPFCIAVSPDGRTLASCSLYGELWDVSKLSSLHH